MTNRSDLSSSTCNSIRSMRAIRHIAGELGVGLYGPNPE
jgi:hypothetical protein